MRDTKIKRASRSAGTPLQSSASPPARILVADDDTTILRLVAEVLTDSSYEVDTADDGVAAWKALQAHEYDLLITDNSMPKVSGVDLLKKLLAARMTIPVIMASGTMPEDEFDRYPSIRPTGTLLKPYSAEEMLSLVKKVLGQAGVTGPFSLAAQPHCILVVDEDSDLRMLYAEALSRPGYHVDVVEDGVAAWEALQMKNYHLLITEHEVPRLSGLELVRKLRAAHMDLPIVMAAGRLPMHELAQTPSLQLAATLVKPFAVDVLLDTVETALRVADPISHQI